MAFPAGGGLPSLGPNPLAEQQAFASPPESAAPHWKGGEFAEEDLLEGGVAPDKTHEGRTRRVSSCGLEGLFPGGAQERGARTAAGLVQTGSEAACSEAACSGGRIGGSGGQVEHRPSRGGRRRWSSSARDLLQRRGDPRGRPRGGLLREDALARGAGQRGGREAHGLGGSLGISASDRCTRALDGSANGSADGTIASRTLDALTVPLFGGDVVGHECARNWGRE